MPLENLEEEGLPKNPDLRVAQLKFLLGLDGFRQDAALRAELMEAVRANSESRPPYTHMGPPDRIGAVCGGARHLYLSKKKKTKPPTKPNLRAAVCSQPLND